MMPPLLHGAPRVTLRVAASTLLLILLLAANADAATIRSYTTRLQIHDDGTAQAVITVAISGATPGPLSLPVGFADVVQPALGPAPAGTVLEVRPAGAQSVARVTLPDGTGPDVTIELGFVVTEAFQRTTPAAGEKSTLPAGARLFRQVFVNTQEAPIGDYRFEVLFPDGARAHAVREALPKLKKTEVGPRVRLASIEGKAGARLQISRLLQGDSASMLIELVPQSRSYGWLIVGLVLAVLYLVKFRDQVSSRPE
jgi:hypothetical protein